MKVYVIVDISDIYELPLVVCDSIRKVADWLNVPYSTASDAIYNNSVISGAFRVEVVYI